MPLDAIAGRAYGPFAMEVGEAKVAVAFSSPPYASQRSYDEQSEFRPIPPDEISNRIDAVDSAALDRIAGRVLASPPTFAGLGAVAGVRSYDHLAAKLR